MFYKITSTLKTPATDIEGLSQNSLEVTQAIYDESDSEAFIQIMTIEGLKVTALAYVSLHFELNGKLMSVTDEYFKRCGLEVETMLIDPLSFRNLQREIKVTLRYYEWERDGKRKIQTISVGDAFFDLIPNLNEKNFDTDDEIIKEKHRVLDILSLKRDYTRELERIQMIPSGYPQGHPVHYLIVSHSSENAYDVACSLSFHLHEQKRLAHNHLIQIGVQGRQSHFNDFEPSQFTIKDILKRIAQGSAVFLTINESFFSNLPKIIFDEAIEQLTQEILEARHQTLFFLWSSDKEGKATSRILEKLAAISFVEICDNELSTVEATLEMERILKEQNLDPALASQLLPLGQTTFRPIDVMLAFNDWFDKHLRTSIYPQYSTVVPFAQKVTEEIQGSAYQELQAMIGLEEVKATIDSFIAAHQLYKRQKELGMNPTPPSRHCAFVGSPGTAKTTVARLFGRILRENGILAIGEFHEATRANIIERYVGWTAKNVRRLINAAKGGVLFIDEAYALLDDREGSFGDEAIAEIVASMENNLDEVVIILAGYKDKMENLLKRNPGLRSRISFIMEFKDYSTQQLTEIAEKMAKDRGLRLTDDARLRIHELMKETSTRKDFGNGRFARNLVEHAVMKQASRLYKTGIDKATEDDIRTLTAEDFPEPNAEVVSHREAFRSPAKRFS